VHGAMGAGRACGTGWAGVMDVLQGLSRTSCSVHGPAILYFLFVTRLDGHWPQTLR